MIQFTYKQLGIWMVLLVFAIVAGLMYTNSFQLKSFIESPHKQADDTQWSQYVDMYENYSVKYPINWLIMPSTGIGTNTTIENYEPDPDSAGDVLPKDYIKIELFYDEDNATNLPIEEWYREKLKRFDETSGMPPVKVVEESYYPAIEIDSEYGSGISRYMAVGNRVFTIRMFTGEKFDKEVFTEVANSFRQL